jgi:quercetin dioxygenase-like cupin family protein
MTTHPYVIRAVSDAPAQVVSRARGATMQTLIGPDDGAPRFAKRLFTLAPGGRIPKHWHPDIEHVQYVVAGELRLGLGDDEHIVRAGDSVFIPAKTPHWYENRGAVPVQFLCVVPRTAQYVTEWEEEPPEGAAP